MPQDLEPFMTPICTYSTPTALGHVLLPGSFSAPALPHVPIMGYEGSPGSVVAIHVGYVQRLDVEGDVVYASGVVMPGTFGEGEDGLPTRTLAPEVTGGIWAEVTLINSGVLQSAAVVPISTGTW